MKKQLYHSVLSAVLVTLGLVVAQVHLIAQDSMVAGFGVPIKSNASDFRRLKTLDDIRQLSFPREFELWAVRDLTDNSLTIESLSRLTSVEAAKEKIQLLKKKLNDPDENRAHLETQLKSLLNQYFIADMRRRVSELDDLREKLNQTESKLQRRLSEREEAVDLQLKIILRDADGDQFFSSGDEQTRATPVESQRVSNPYGMDSGFGADTGLGYGSEGPAKGNQFEGEGDCAMDDGFGVDTSLGYGSRGPAKFGNSPGGAEFMMDGLINALAGGNEAGEEPVQNARAKIIAPKKLALSTVLSKAQTLVLEADDMLWEHLRLPPSFNEKSCERLAGAILRALGSEADSGKLLWFADSAALHVRFSMDRYERFGKPLQKAFHILAKEANERQDEETDEAAENLLGGQTSFNETIDHEQFGADTHGTRHHLVAPDATVGESAESHIVLWVNDEDGSIASRKLSWRKSTAPPQKAVLWEDLGNESSRKLWEDDSDASIRTLLWRRGNEAGNQIQLWGDNSPLASQRLFWRTSHSPNHKMMLWEDLGNQSGCKLWETNQEASSHKLLWRTSERAEIQGGSDNDDSELGDRENIGARASTLLTFSGQVLKGQDPVSGVTISLWQRIGHYGFYKEWHPNEEVDVRPNQVAVSGDDGSFEFTFSTKQMKDSPWNIWPEPWRSVQVVASKDGMGVGWCNLGELRTRKKIWIRGTAPVSGRVINTEGQPVPGASIGFYYLSDDVPSHRELWQPSWVGLSSGVTTDAEGQFVIKGLPTNRTGIHLWVKGAKIATKIFNLDLADAPTSVEVVVEPTKPIHGTVRDITTGEPVSGVMVYGNEDTAHRLVRSRTNERGEYKLLGLPKAKQYQITTRPPISSGYLVRYTSTLDTTGLESIPHDISIRPGVPVELTVVDKQTRLLLQPEVHYAPTDDNPLHREASRGAYKPGDGFNQFYAPDENGVVRFNAYPGRGLIRVVLQGEPGYLLVGDTDEIRKGLLTDINFAFAASSHSYAIIAPDENRGLLKLELEADPGASITGKLVDREGRPVEGATAENLNFDAAPTSAYYGMNQNVPEGYGSGLGTRLGDHTFVVRKLKPGKSRQLVFIHDERKLIATPVLDENSKSKEVVMLPWATIRGIVHDGKGVPLEGANIIVDYPSRSAEGRWTKRPESMTDKQGTFYVERLLPGETHRLSVSLPGTSKHEEPIAVEITGEHSNSEGESVVYRLKGNESVEITASSASKSSH